MPERKGYAGHRLGPGEASPDDEERLMQHAQEELGRAGDIPPDVARAYLGLYGVSEPPSGKLDSAQKAAVAIAVGRVARE